MVTYCHTKPALDSVHHHTNGPVPGLILNLTTFCLTDINFIGCSVQCRCRSIAEISCKGRRNGTTSQTREGKTMILIYHALACMGTKLITGLELHETNNGGN